MAATKLESDGDDDFLPSNWQSFPDGSILRLEFHNFLTYEDTICKPGENLNLILGHNGSGKSSIICGICLVFGGSPKSLGRSEKITEYIRHGCLEAFVEAVIADGNKGPQKIRLSIRIGKSPEYKLNDQVTTQKNIRDLSKMYNIQIDNPCAFLAQDKVKSFSEQSPVDLLFNTEKAASAELYEEHLKLIENRDDFKEIDNKCSTAQTAVTQTTETIAKLEPLVENYRKKRQMQKKLRALEKKMAVLEYEAADANYRDVVNRFDEINEQVENQEKKCKEFEKKAEIYSSRAKKERQSIDANKQKGRDLLSKVECTLDKNIIQKRLENARRELVEQQKKHEKNKAEKVECKRRIEHCEKKKSEAEEDLKDHDAFLEYSRREERKLMDLDLELRSEEDEISKIAYTITTMRNKLREQERSSRDGFNRRLNLLKSMSHDSARAYEYYYNNRDKFRDKIYVPIMDMTLRSPDSAKFIENSVGGRDWYMFICSNKDDEKNINDSRKGWRINSAVVRPEKVYSNEINVSVPDSLHQLGFKHFVSETFDAPDPLKQYLCNVYHLNRIPVGGNAVEQNIGRVAEGMAKTKYQVFMTPNIRNQISVSRYSGETMQSQSQMRTPYYWHDPWFSKPAIVSNVDGSLNSEIEEMTKEVDRRKKEFHIRKTEIQKSRDKLKSETSTWRDKKQILFTIRNNLDSERSKLERLENEKIDVAKAEKAFEKERLCAEEGAKEMFKECYKLQKKYIDLYKDIACSIAIYNSCQVKKEEILAEKGDLYVKMDNFKQAKRVVEDELRIALNKKKLVVESLKEKCGLEHLDIKKMDSIQKAIWEKLCKVFEDDNIPKDIDTLEKQLNSERTRLKLAEDGDDGSAEDEAKMEKLKEQLTEEKDKLSKLMESKTNYENNLGDLIGKWRGRVEEMIEEINENYRIAFQKLGCVGEIHLECPENLIDISNYGIMIMVCFRSGEKLKRLDQKVQSGGERSVSTMLYLLALQQLCPVPFRCVDEINQGMDPTNERKVFEIMVDLWSGSGTLAKTQYFLLTPKLLHGLAMNERVTVQIVHSAVPKVYKNWNSEKFISATTASVSS